MLKIVIIGTIATLAAAAYHPVNPEIVKDIKNKATAWTPMEVEENPLAKVPAQRIMGLMGTTIRAPPAGARRPVPTNDKLPTNFDSRDKFTGCVHTIRNQQHCGSCWAFGSSEALSDRFCIASQGKIDVILSPQDMVSCDDSDYGCQGGYLDHAWNYLENYGIVSDKCFPYTSGDGTAPQCLSGDSCADSSVEFAKYKCAEGSVVVGSTPREIKEEIFKNGPMETAFTVYEDFMNYKGGVYHYTSGKLLGGHAIKVLGWGHDEASGLDYWLCANSWDTTWGEKGFFRIKQGELGIDDGAYACQPDVSSIIL